jgi:hypothetical protein
VSSDTSTARDVAAAFGLDGDTIVTVAKAARSLGVSTSTVWRWSTRGSGGRRPDLAALPVDTNSYRFEPLHAEPGDGVARAFEKLGRQLGRAAQPFLRSSDPRRYERVFNVDEPRWQPNPTPRRPGICAGRARGVTTSLA